MAKLIFLLICYNLLRLNLAKDNPPENMADDFPENVKGMAEYNPPKSVEYPFGDEELNTDIKETHVPEEFKPILIQEITDIYTFCPNTTEIDEVDQFGAGAPYFDRKCQKCDIRPTVDKKGALVECFNCSDVTFLDVPELNDVVDHVLFLTNFLQITNYTAPEDM